MRRGYRILGLALWLGVGCGDAAGDEGPLAVDSGAGRDAAAMPPPAMPPPPPSDAGPTAGDGGLDDPDAAVPPGRPDPGTGLDSDWAACGGITGDEAHGSVSCEGACATSPICCADSDACCVEGATRLAVDFASCTGTADDACLAELEVVGTTRPAVISGALWMAPAGPSYVAVASRARFDASSTLETWAEVTSLRGCRPGECQEMVGVGIAQAAVTSPDAADLAAVLSAATGQILLLSRGEVLRRAPVDLGAPTSGRLSLAIDARGAATATFVTSDGGTLTSTTSSTAPLPSTAIRTLAFGRGDNAREATLVVGQVGASTRVCDRPSAWGIEPIAITNGRELPGRWSAMAVADGLGVSGPERRFLLSAGDRVFAGALAVDGTISFRTDVEGAITGLYSDGFPPIESLGSLVYSNERARWELYVSRAGLDVVRIPSNTGDTFDRSASEPVITRDEAGATSIDQPNVAIDFRGYETLAFRATDSTGRAWIASAQRFGGGTWWLDDDTLAPSERSDAFDRDGVESPSVVVYGELTHLYYAGRRGVARSLGLARRTATGGWDRYSDGAPVLVPGDEPWRTFGVGAPAVVVGNTATGATSTLDVYFLATGDEGVSMRRAHREVPWIGH